MEERTVETLEQDLKTEHDLYLRALADFDNYRRRVDRERSRFGREALRNFLPGLLDVMDDLERFLTFVGDKTSPFNDGIRAVHHKLGSLLEKEGVRPFESVGTPFDASLHEAVATAEAAEHEQGSVVQEIRRGYKWNDDLLRPARVVVAAEKV
jgi:molecular chaperone GrpE